MAWRSRHTRGDASLAFVAFYAMGLLAVTLLQRRFFNSSAVPLALLLAWSLVETWRSLGGEQPSRARRAAALAAVALAGAWLVWPLADAYRGPVANVKHALAGEPVRLPPGLVRQRAFRRAAAWLRANSPPTSGWLAPGAQPEYGVMASWTHGHLIEFVARRPSIANNFGDDLGEENFLASYRYFEAEGPEAERMLSALCARYVLFRTAAGADLQVFPKRSLNYRLSLPVPDVAHLRMVYDEPMPPRGGVSRIRIFENRAFPPACRAQVRGAAAPDANGARGL